MTGTISMVRMAAELKWLQEHPAFEQRPATIREFVGADYLNIEAGIRPAVLQELENIVGKKVRGDKITEHQLAMFSGAIGIGKTTVASVILPYLAHWVLCLKDPQDFFELLPGSRIAFMQMSTSGTQAKEVVFGDIKARIEHSPWFMNNFPFDSKFKNQIRFPKDIWILPGDSEETTFEGYNILGGILDEADCVDRETEILTGEGWKTFDKLRVGDEILTLNNKTGLSEWQPCLEVKVFDPDFRVLTLMEGKEFSSLTTHNHRWPVERPSSGRRWVTTETLGFRDRISRAAMPADLPTESKYSDALVELVAWFWTEGHDVEGRGHTLWLHQSPKNEENVARIRAALYELFGDPVETFPRQGSAHDYLPRWREKLVVNKNEYWGSKFVWTLSAGAGTLVQQCAPGKVPSFEFLRCLTKSQLELFIAVSLLADNNGLRRLSQKNKKAAEAFAFACILSGRPVSIRERQPTKSCPSVMTSVYSSLKRVVVPVYAAYQGKSFSITSQIYTDIVWCPRVSNGSWLARRKGTIYFTGNSHKMTDNKDYAEQGFTTIYSRITSRFGDRGFLMVIGQMKRSSGFAARKFAEFQKDPKAYAVRMTIWESFGWEKFLNKDGTRDSFWYDPERHDIIPPGVAAITGSKKFIEIPNLYLKDFQHNPEKALRDLAGIPPAAGSPFISLTYKVTEARNRWIERTISYQHPEGLPGPVDEKGKLQGWFYADSIIKRACHIDLGYSAKGDAAGFAMGHVPEMVVVEGERKPFIVIDLMMRWHAPAGREIFLGDIRQFIYQLRDERKFKINKVTMDGFQSVDTRQQLERRRIWTELVSVDKILGPYHDLREAIYENRIAFPPYFIKFHEYDTELVEIAIKELVELEDDGKKIDHPEQGSKDIADSLAGLVYTLMGDRTYHRRSGIPPTPVNEGSQKIETTPEGRVRISHPALAGLETVHAPVPPSLGGEPTWRPPPIGRR